MKVNYYMDGKRRYLEIKLTGKFFVDHNGRLNFNHCLVDGMKEYKDVIYSYAEPLHS